MNVALRKPMLRRPMTVEQFLEWEERQELRYEFDGFQPIAMTGGSYEHDAIQINLVSALKARLAGKPCRVHGNSLKIRVMESIRYPDAYVTCGPIERGSMIAPDPVVVFEVLSKSTSRTDYTVKNREYASTASIQRYVMLEQTEIAGMVFTRAGEEWGGRLLAPDAVLQMPEIGIELPLAELYEGLDLADPPGGKGRPRQRRASPSQEFKS